MDGFSTGRSGVSDCPGRGVSKAPKTGAVGSKERGEPTPFLFVPRSDVQY
jgi:hypothetical protein